MDALQADQTASQSSREARFVSAIIDRCQQDKGGAARLRRADNPATEYQSWDILASLGINLENERERLPAVTVAAAIARAKAEQNGSVSLGQALVSSYENDRDSSPAKARLRRLLACTELDELARQLRSILMLVNSKSGQRLDYERLLKQLKSFAFDPQRVRAQWAQEFYNRPQPEQMEGEPS